MLHCVTQAQQWLGINSAEKVLAETPVDHNFAKARPLGLGLGAKYLPHHKVWSINGRFNSTVLCTHTRNSSLRAVIIVSAKKSFCSARILLFTDGQHTSATAVLSSHEV